MVCGLIEDRRLTRRQRLRLLLILLCNGVAATGCSVGAAPAHLVEPTECNDTSLCDAGFYLGDDFFSVSCGAVRPDLVGADIVATGRYSGADTEVREIVGVDPLLLLAIRRDGGRCDGTESDPMSGWSMVFPAGEQDQAAVGAAVCAAVVAQQRELNGCT